MKAEILIVDDREGIRVFLKEALTSATWSVTSACNGLEALAALKKQRYDLMITDLKMPRMDGDALTRITLKEYPWMTTLVLTAHGSIEHAVSLIKRGAFDYLSKPLDSPDALRNTVRRALKHSALRVAAGAGNGHQMIVQSPAMKEVQVMLGKVAPTTSTVLLEGESGTGKEVAALHIHRQSSRADAPFMAVNCAAISPQLIESELFGHEKGAFTGALEQKAGRFEAAAGGTIFLDEIGELPLTLQPKLLRALQEKAIERVGSTNSIPVDVRIIAATNRNLLQMVADRQFREDLYHRLSVFPVTIPPLRDRVDDILPIAHHFLARITDGIQSDALFLTQPAKEALVTYRWPGNIRELGNVLERAAILCTPPTIGPSDLRIDSPATPPTSSDEETFSLKNIERDAIINALKETDGHRKKAAALLGIGLRTLYNKIGEYNIE